MAIINNVDLINTYDGNFRCISQRILADIAPHQDEFAAQVVALETLRTLIASGMTVQQYNDLTDEAWQAIIDQSVERAKLNVNSPIVISLSPTDIGAAANLGGNFFEHGYQTILDATAIENKVEFTKLGGV